VVGHAGEHPGLGSQDGTGCGGQHGVGERAAVADPRRADELGEAERGDEVDVGEAAAPEGAAGQEPADGQAGGVGGDDDRDPVERVPALGVGDPVGQRLGRRATEADDVDRDRHRLLEDRRSRHGPDGTGGV
jgi:hypothetical protein